MAAWPGTRLFGWAALCLAMVSASPVLADSAVPAPVSIPAPVVPVVTPDNFLRLKAEVVDGGGIVVASFDLRGVKFAWQQWENVGTGPETYATRITPDQQNALIATLAKAAFPGLKGRYEDPGQPNVNYHAITLYLRGSGPRPQEFQVRATNGLGPAGYSNVKTAIGLWLRSVVPATSYAHWFF